MKKYKDEKKNEKVKECVKDYVQRPFGLGHKYCTNNEWETDLAARYNISYGMARKVREIVRCDAYRKELALQVWGFNTDTLEKELRDI